MQPKPYSGQDDLLRLQQFNAEQIRLNPLGWLQPGDIPHRLYNGHRDHEPSQLIRLWEDALGNILGWAFVFPDESFDIQAHDPAVIAEALRWVEATLPAETLETDLWGDADPRRALLLAHGYEQDEDELPYWVTFRPLQQPIPAPDLPDGFSIRTARGLEDAAQLAEVHAGAFDSDWTAATYTKVMQSPGYDPAREFVVVAPDGRLAAFTVTWHDFHNKTGYFEPVGTHRDFQKRGLARALLCHVMGVMKAIGLDEAIVVHEPPDENRAAAQLYTSVGFELRYETYLYCKHR